jgi:chloramphenicol 3-O phosphotransferase
VDLDQAVTPDLRQVDILTAEMGNPDRPLVILLTGPSLAGKSSLARALLARISVPCLYLEADAVFPKLSPAYARSIANSDVQHGLTVALHRSLATWPDAGYNVIIDGSLPGEALRGPCVSLLAQFDLKIVKVFCDRSHLERRELQRDCVPGWAPLSHQDGDLVYDAVVDTSEHSPEECAAAALLQLGLS